MRYMCFVKHPENQNQPPQALMDAMGKHVQKAFKAGTLIDTGGLAPVSAAIHVRLEGGDIKVKDGPYTEAKEIIGGYAVMKFDTQEEAIQAAKDFMELHRQHWPGWEGESEVRQIFGMED